ncbi:hypothetical protein DSC45_34685 [Streptomyces sp. YIM 130001]|nr:hypothetical protein [Streptomyces sp. YIM 130001]RII06977.1 hypothetical protein DSC45_34685 [Streptomyces sp. YIM 130001]
MTAIAVEITPRPRTLDEEPAGLVLIEDIESLTDDAIPGCGDDNPYN